MYANVLSTCPRSSRYSAPSRNLELNAPAAWFDLSSGDAGATHRVIGQLHEILQTFMLRRLKSDVAKARALRRRRRSSGL
jgi:hypothetical protein